MKLHSRNLIAVVTSDGAARLLGFITTAYLARIIAIDSFGVISYGMAILSYAFLTSSPGLHIIGSKLSSRKDVSRSRVLSRITFLRLLLGAVSGLLIFGSAELFITDTRTKQIVQLYALTLLPFALQIEWFFQGKELMHIAGACRTCGAFAYTALVFFFITADADLAKIPVIFFASSSLQSLLLYAFYLLKKDFRHADDTVMPPPVAWRSLLKESIPVGWGSLLSQIVLNFPLILLGAFRTDAEVGLYGAAAKLIFFLLAVDRAIYYLFFPLVSRTYAADPDALPALCSRVYRYVFALALPLAAGACAVSKPLVTMVYGNQYAGASLIFALLTLFFLATVINSLSIYLLIAAEKERRYSRIMSFSSFAMFPFLLLSVVFGGTAGVAAGMSAGESVIMLLLLTEIKKHVALSFDVRILKIALSALAMSFMANAALSSGELGTAIAVGIVVYPILLAATGAVIKEDIHFLKERFL